jgi:hypothetical protein
LPTIFVPVPKSSLTPFFCEIESDPIFLTPFFPGRTMSLPDGQIAGIAHAHGFAVATRNIKDFEGCGIELINPFE